VQPVRKPTAATHVEAKPVVKAEAPKTNTEGPMAAMPPVAVVSEGGNSLPSLGGTSGLPSIGGGRRPFGGLGGVGNRAGMFDYDESYLKNAQADLAKLNAISEPGIGGDEEEKKEEDSRSML